MDSGKAGDIVAAMIERAPHGESIADRNRRRELQARESKLLGYIGGVYAYSGFVTIVMAVSAVSAGLYAEAITFAVTLGVIASVGIHMWRRKQLPLWILLMPCVGYVGACLSESRVNIALLLNLPVPIASILVSRVWKRLYPVTVASADSMRAANSDQVIGSGDGK